MSAVLEARTAKRASVDVGRIAVPVSMTEAKGCDGVTFEHSLLLLSSIHKAPNSDTFSFHRANRLMDSQMSRINLIEFILEIVPGEIRSTILHPPGSGSLLKV